MVRTTKQSLRDTVRVVSRTMASGSLEEHGRDCGGNRKRASEGRMDGVRREREASRSLTFSTILFQTCVFLFLFVQQCSLHLVDSPSFSAEQFSSQMPELLRDPSYTHSSQQMLNHHQHHHCSLDVFTTSTLHGARTCNRELWSCKHETGFLQLRGAAAAILKLRGGRDLVDTTI